MKNQKKYICNGDRPNEEYSIQEKGVEWVMYHNDLELICYSNDLPYLNARKGFKPQNNLKWKMEKRLSMI